MRTTIAAMCLFWATGAAWTAENPTNTGSRIELSGYIQVQGYIEDRADGNVHSTTREGGFFVRRARLSATGSLGSAWEYELQVNGNDSAVELEDAYLVFKGVPWLEITAGRFTIPFGQELYESSKRIPFVERSRIWAWLFNERQNIGAEGKVKLGDLALQAAYFQTYGSGTPDPTEIDLALRLAYTQGPFTAGACFYYDEKRTNGTVLLDVERKFNVFAAYRADGFSLSGEAVGVLTGNMVNEFGGILAATGRLSSAWEAVARLSYLRLKTPASSGGHELDMPGDLVAGGESESWEATLGCNLLLMKDSRLSFNWQPSLHPGKRWAHAGLVQLQVAF